MGMLVGKRVGEARGEGRDWRMEHVIGDLVAYKARGEKQWCSTHVSVRKDRSMIAAQ